MGFYSRVVVVENDGFSVAKRGHGPLKRLMQVRFFSVWWKSGGIWGTTLC